MKKEKAKEEKIKEWGKLTLFAVIMVAFLFLLSHVLGDISETGEIIYMVILIVFSLAFLIASAGFIILTIIHQFNKNMSLWAIANILISVIAIIGAFQELGVFTVGGALISCSIYYFMYLNPKLKKK